MKSFLLSIFCIISIFSLTGCSLQNTQNGNTVTTSETVQVGHNGTQFVPASIKLAKGKKYTINVTPSSNGKGCMTQVVIPGKGPQEIIANQPFTIEVDGTVAKTIPLVCSSMGMKQGEIVIQ